MKEILIVVPDDKLGGSEQLLKNITLFHLQNNDFVHVIFYKKSISGQWDDLKTFSNISLNFTSAASDLRGIPFAIYTLFKIRRTFDLIYTSHLHTNSIIGILIKLKIVKKKSFIGRESTSYFLRYKGKQLEIFKLLYRLGYSSLDLVICQSEEMKQQLITGLPKLMAKINVQVIPNPINLKAIKEQKANPNLNFLKNEEFIVSAGRLIWEKGYDILIEAFCELKKDYPKLKLKILGEGNCRPELEEQLAKLNLKNEVILTGQVANVYDYFKEARLCVVSSKIEGFPNVLLQMMSQNNRVVSTRCAGGIEDLEGVVTANTYDSEDLYRKIKIALKMDVSHNSERFKKQLEARSLENFSQKIHTYLK